MSVGVIIAMAAGGTVLLAAGLTWMGVWLNKSYKRDEQAALGRLREEMPRRGWTFAERDDTVAELYTRQMAQFGGRDPRKPLAGPPKATAAPNVITGVHRGRPFLAASLDTYYNGEFSEVCCVWVRTPTVRPTTLVQRAVPVASKINNAIWGEVRTGHPQFDEMFDVWSEDPGFAVAMLSPALIEFLIHDPETFRDITVFADHLEVLDRVGDHRDPARLIPALDRRCDILDRIPRTVWA
ncbi:DUF3137 domain-containing protein [Amycolatopsis sp. K13G38]|uniref:DUF3137 domain-containing protein n=1 Tax=Amycolatopsis acididurans TaxID=2724524 RepID=A0ABX1J9U6_9PSEU|nr:DUF3137 domain-containing protein [Amycolatopsis acididurans]NKQ56459.1 DUF3137 domain-containing protein [Amycolatopsis acididurans]